MNSSEREGLGLEQSRVVSHLFSVTGSNIVVGKLLVIIILVIKILQSFLFLQFAELTTQIIHRLKINNPYVNELQITNTQMNKPHITVQRLINHITGEQNVK